MTSMVEMIKEKIGKLKSFTIQNTTKRQRTKIRKNVFNSKLINIYSFVEFTRLTDNIKEHFSKEQRVKEKWLQSTST